MPRVTIVTQYWPPEMGAPQGRLSELAERLIDLDWHVETLTALPNYPTGRVFDGYDPLRPTVEDVGRVRTVRVPLYPSKKGFVKRMGTYLSFAASASAVGPFKMRRPDVLFVESPPLFIIYAAWALSMRWRVPYVLNVSDLWPETAVRMGVVSEDAVPTKMLAMLERSAYRRAAAVTGQSQGIIDGVKARAPQTPTCLITNGVEPARFGRKQADADARALLGPAPGPVFVYAGLLGLAQGLDQVLDASKRLPDSVPGRFVLIGDGPVREHLEARVRDEKLTRVEIRGPQPRERIPAILAAADAAIITLGMEIPGAVPSKIYEAMASEIPIVLVATGEPARRVEQPGAGRAVAPGQIDGLVEIISDLASDPDQRQTLGAAGRRAAETTYNRHEIAKRLSEFLSSVALGEHRAQHAAG